MNRNVRGSQYTLRFDDTSKKVLNKLKAWLTAVTMVTNAGKILFDLVCLKLESSVLNQLRLWN